MCHHHQGLRRHGQVPGMPRRFSHADACRALRLQPDGLNRCRATVLSGAVPALTADESAAAVEADRIHQRLCRRIGLNSLSANGSFVKALS